MKISERMSEKETQEIEPKDQEKIIVYQLLQNQLEELKQQMIMVEEQIAGLNLAREIIDELGGKERETLIPLGSGFYAHGKLIGEKIITDNGAGVMIEKSKLHAKETIEKRKEELEEVKEKLQTDINKVVKNINEILPEIQKIAEKLNK